MTVKRFSKNEIDALNITICKRITSALKLALKDQLSHKDSDVSFIYDGSVMTKNIATIVLSYPDLMGESQRRADLSDAMSIAWSFDRVKRVKESSAVLPTFTDLYNGVMPCVSFEIDLV